MFKSYVWKCAIFDLYRYDKLFIWKFGARYPTYSWSNEQYGLDTHIPSRTNANMIYTEFEAFFQGLLKDIGNTPETELQLIKIKYEMRARSTRK